MKGGEGTNPPVAQILQTNRTGWLKRVPPIGEWEGRVWTNQGREWQRGIAGGRGNTGLVLGMVTDIQLDIYRSLREARISHCDLQLRIHSLFFLNFKYMNICII